MSVRFLNNNASSNTDVSAKTFPSVSPPPLTPWIRSPSWPACEANAGDNRVRGLYAVWPGGANFIAMTVAGAYTVDYGDGTTTNYTTGSTAYYEYDYADADLAGTDAPVTFTDAGDLVTRTAHGYTNGMQVQFFNIASTTGIVNSQFYFVINATANTFQVAATTGGAALALTTDGTGTLLPYKVATVTITPQGGSNLTSINLFVKHNQAGLVNSYSTNWLDIAFAASTITTLTLGSSGTTVRHFYIERVRLNQLGSITTFVDLFRNLIKLQNIDIADTITTVTSMTTMFLGCSSLQTVPLFNTASVTNIGNMFQGCVNLQEVPLFNTALVTTMSNMFNSCLSIKTVPLFNTASVTNINSMFSGCSSLQTVPLFNTALVANIGNMFQNCFSLKTVPLFNTSAVTNMTSMFQSCVNLQEVPLFNTSAVITINNMFNNCSSIKTVPLFNTASVTNISSMFSSCYSLQTVPLFNTALVTTMSNMFNSCIGLTTVPSLVTTAVTSASNFSSMFNACSSLARIEAKDFLFTFSVASCKLSATALNEIYTNLPTVTAQTITVTGNYGTATDDPTIATAKGWTVTG